MPAPGVFPSVRVVRGRLVKRCVTCGKEKPVDQFYARNGNRGGWHASCKVCWSISRGSNAGLVPLSEVRFALVELINRVGKAETARRIGTTAPNLWKWFNTPPEKIRREHAKALLLALKEARDKDEVRHRDDIVNGAELRGKTVRMATKRDELYKPK